MIKVEEAIEKLGLTTRVNPAKVFIGNPCPKGHSTGLRYIKGYHCVECTRSDEHRLKAKRQHQLSYEKTKDRWKLYHQSFLKTAAGRACLLLTGARARAKRGGLEVTLTNEWVRERLEKGVCEMSGIPFHSGPKERNTTSPYSPSIDRIDSSKGYTPENCRVVLWALNAAFGHWGEETFRKIATQWLSNTAA